MAQTYTVKSGDTLSAIAAKYGTSVGSISGYKSGNPNLIYPGEVLSIGGKAPASTGGGGGGGGAQPYLPLPTAPKFTQATQFSGAAKKEIAPIYDPQIQGLQGQLPLLQKRYDQYLEQLTTAGQQRKEELQTGQLADISKTGAAASSRGLRGGLVEAQTRGVETTYNKLINTLTTDIEAQRKDLGISREEKDLELRSMIASLVGQKASKITELARNLSNEENTRRMQAFSNLLSIAQESFSRYTARENLALSKQELALSQQRLARETLTAKKEKVIDDFAGTLGSTKNFQRDMAIINNYLRSNPSLKAQLRTVAYSLGKGKEFDAASGVKTTAKKESKSSIDKLKEKLGIK